MPRDLQSEAWRAGYLAGLNEAAGIALANSRIFASGKTPASAAAAAAGRDIYDDIDGRIKAIESGKEDPIAPQ